jgi:hypothetical protein
VNHPNKLPSQGLYIGVAFPLDCGTKKNPRMYNVIKFQESILTNNAACYTILVDTLASSHNGLVAFMRVVLKFMTQPGF